MSKRWFVETTPQGRQQFVAIKRSRSYGGAHHHRVREIDYIKVSLDEWNTLVEKERKLQEINRSVVDDCNVLKGENKRLAVQIGSLTAEIDSLRRGLGNAGDHSVKHHREEERLKHKLAKVEADNLELREQNAGLREKNRSLSRQLDQSFSRRVSELVGDADYWKYQYKHWRSRYEELLKRYNDIYDRLETRTTKMKAYEDILKRNEMV